MPELSGSTTHDHLAEAFARDSQANLRYVWFAQQADIEGRPDEAALFRSLADSETSHALGLLEFLADVGDPLTGEPIGDTDENLASALAAETNDHDRLFPAFAQTAREEGFHAVADWFETLASAERSHAKRLRDALGDR
ncbi:MAG: rubrerythrin family protein [Ilumatobacteraceae bacterium]